MVEDSPKYAIAAWNLYQTGRYELTINNHGYPSWGGLGYGFLIVPSFWLFGLHLGNAIYSQTAMSVLICVLVYVSVRLCLGILPAAIAALLLPLYPDFNEYARMIDTDVPAAFFLVLGLLIFLWILRETRFRSWKWLLWGLCAGWGTAVRTSSLAAFAALTVTLACLSHHGRGETLRNLFAALIGSLPLMAPLLWYNHHYCGSCFRDPHAFWESREFDNLAGSFGLRFVFGMPDPGTENLNYSGNLIFYGREIVSQFTMWPRFVAQDRFLVHAMTYFLSGVMVVGLLCICRRARGNPAARLLLWYAAVGAGTTLLFYLLKRGGNIRYVVPLIPFASIFVGTAVVDVTRWLGRQPLLRIMIPVFLLLSGAIPYRLLRLGGLVRIGELVPTTLVLEDVSAGIESNAVVIGSDHWELINHVVIRGTARQFVPFNNRRYFRVQPKAPLRQPTTHLAATERNDEAELQNGAVDIFDYSAVEDPQRIQELLAHGLPVYIVCFPLDPAFSADTFRGLEKHFIISPWQVSVISISPVKGADGVRFALLWKVESKQALP